MSFSVESERGAILLACHIVDNFLLQKISENKNPKASQRVLRDTTNFGGAFGSLSMKTKSLFVLGILSEQVFNAVESLRGIRNKAAHSENAFSLATRGPGDQMLGANLHYPLVRQPEILGNLGHRL